MNEAGSTRLAASCTAAYGYAANGYREEQGSCSGTCFNARSSVDVRLGPHSIGGGDLPYDSDDLERE